MPEAGAGGDADLLGDAGQPDDAGVRSTRHLPAKRAVEHHRRSPAEERKMMFEKRLLFQSAPWPAELEDLVSKVKLWPGWVVWLEKDLLRDPKETHGTEGRGSTLIIRTKTYNTYHIEDGPHYKVHHYFIVPAATWNRRSWQRWLFDRFADVQFHEAMEAFMVDGMRPFAPHHGPGENPYVLMERGTDTEARTTFKGEVK